MDESSPSVPEPDADPEDRSEEEPRPTDALVPTASNGASGSRSDPATGSWARLQWRLFRAAVRHFRTSDRESREIEPPPRRVGSYARWLPVLRAIPWLLGAVFALSFVWDLTGVTLTVAGYSIVLDNLLRVTAVSGLIGFGTNWLAITMLFRPRQERPLVGQGLVPSQRERVAYRLAEAVSDELINKRLMKEKIRESGLVAEYRDLLVAAASDVATDEAVRDEVKTMLGALLRDILSTPSVQERIVDFTAEQVELHAGRGFPGLALRTYRFFGEDDFRARLYEAVEQLPSSIDPLLEEVDPVLDRLPTRLEEQSEDLEALLMRIALELVDSLDVEEMIYDNVRSYDERQLELLLRRTTNEQLNYIKYLGAVLGVIGGFIIWAPAISLVVFTALGLIIYAVDEALFRRRTQAMDDA